ncbi:MAG TPA: redoxin domain-containing protein [Acidimicrobiia bacterium]|nr:redoxin domain-containing protein [Acidimicrobiia bacterium]
MRGRWAKRAAWGAVALSIALSVALASRFGADPNLVSSPLIGRTAPALTLPLLDGSGEVPLPVGDDRIVVVNFFASWCLECRTEHADLIAVAEGFREAGVQMVQIAFQDDVTAANRFLDELGRSEATLYLDDPGGRAAIAFGVFGVPETYFIDGAGVVVGKIQGESNALLLGQTIDAIRRGEDPGQQVVGDVQTSPEG